MSITHRTVSWTVPAYAAAFAANFYAFAIPGALAAVLVAMVPLIRLRPKPSVDAGHDDEVSVQRAESSR